MKITITKDGKVFKGNTLLKPRLIRGYLKVKIEGSTYSVHRLVAMTYIPNPENKPCVCHKDNNPLNNRVSNLYWGTQKENIQQCIKDGRLRPQGKVPLDIKTRESIRRDYLNTSLSRKELEKKYDITSSI